MSRAAVFLASVPLLLSACSRAPSSAARSDPTERSSTDFVAPNAQGWGRAAGLRFLEVDIAPESSRRNDSPATLILIHGLGDRPRREWAEDLCAGLPLRIVLPEAPTPWLDGFSWFDYRWPDPDPVALAHGIRTAADQLARMLATLQDRRAIRRRPIVAGFSQGGMLSFALALEHPALIDRAIPLSGTLPKPLWPDARARGSLPPIRALHGTADTIVPFASAQALVAHLRGLGYDASLTAYDGVDHRVTSAMAQRLRHELHLALSGPQPAETK